MQLLKLVPELFRPFAEAQHGNVFDRFLAEIDWIGLSFRTSLVFDGAGEPSKVVPNALFDHHRTTLPISDRRPRTGSRANSRGGQVEEARILRLANEAIRDLFAVITHE